MSTPESRSAPRAASVRAARALLRDDAEGGARGAELLSRCLNAALTQIVRVARAWDVDLLRFLGDAALLLVPCAGRADLPAACRRALRVAAALLEPAAPSADVPEPLHASVAAGPLAALRLGGVGGKLELVAHGRPLDRIARGIGLAGPGAVCVAPEVPLPPALGAAVSDPSGVGDAYQVLDALGGPPAPAAGSGPAGDGFWVFEGGSAALAAACEAGPPGLLPGPPPLPFALPAESPPPDPDAVSALDGAGPEPEAPGPGAAGACTPGDPDPAAGDAAYRPYVPKDVDWVLDHGGRFLTELRIITVAFLLLAPPPEPEPAGASASGPDHDEEPLDPGALGAMQRRVCAVQEEAERARGVVRSFFRDDKGGRLDLGASCRGEGSVLASSAGFVALVTFGLAGGGGGADDPLRAALFAVRVRDAFAAGSLGPVSIGLATGRVFCGIVGDPLRRCDYTVLGDSVNLAARGSDEASLGRAQAHGGGEGGRLGGGGTGYATEELPPLSIKGYDGFVRAFALLRRQLRAGGTTGRLSRGHLAGRAASRRSQTSRSRSGSRGSASPDSASASRSRRTSRTQSLSQAGDEGESRLFGRRRQLREIRDFLQRARPSGVGAGVLLIEGEPGSGKSLLLGEALRMAEALGVPAVTIGGDPLEAARPFHALREALRCMLGTGGKGDPVALSSDEEQTDPEASEAGPAAGPPPQLLLKPCSSVRRALPQHWLRSRAQIPSLQIYDIVTDATAEASKEGGGSAPASDAEEAHVRPPEGAGAALAAGDGAGRTFRNSFRRSFKRGGELDLEAAAGAGAGAGAEAAGKGAGGAARLALLKVLRRVEPRLATLPNARMLDLLLREGPAAADAEEGEGGSPGDAEALLAFAGAFLLAVMRRFGGLLAVDDAPHLDSATRRLLAALAAAPGTSLLLTCPPPASCPACSQMEALRASPRARLLPLPPFSPLETRAFVDAAAEAVPPWLASELAEQSRGNPFLIQEMVAHLRGQHVLARMPDGALVVFDERGDPLPFPERRGSLPLAASLERLVVSRLDRISPEAALCCRLLSVLGARFDVALAREALEAGGVLVRDDARRGVPEYRFASAATAALMAEADRRRLHWRAALALEARPAASAAMLAHHCERAGAALAAAAQIAVANARAGGADAPPGGLAPLRGTAEGRAAAGTPLAVARRSVATARALFSLGHLASAADALEEALRLLGIPLARDTPGLLGAAASLLKVDVPACTYPSRPAPSDGGSQVVVSGPARAAPPKRHPPEDADREKAGGPISNSKPAEDAAAQYRRCAGAALSLYAHLLVHRGDAVGAVVYSARNVLIASREPASAGYAEACAFIYSILTRARVHGRAGAYLRRAREIARLPGCGGALGYILSNQVTNLTLLGRLAEAEEMGARGALELASLGTRAPLSRRR
eukprot:tig00000204_g17743.t1